MSWIRGDTNRITITVTDSGEAVGLTNAVIKAVIVQHIGGAALVSKTTGDFTLAGNVATCVLAVADTATLEPGIYWVEGEVTDMFGLRMSAQGQISISEDSI